MAEQPTFLTKEGLKNLEQELHHLQTVRRHEVAERLHAAMEEGDIDENAEYDDAKNEQSVGRGIRGRSFLFGPVNELRHLVCPRNRKTK